MLLQVTVREKYDVQLPFWCNCYLLTHFCIVVYGFQELASIHMGLNALTVFGFVLYIIASLTTIGMIFDNHPYASVFELLRCMVLVTAIQRMNMDADKTLLGFEVFFIISGFFWFLQSLKVIQITLKSKTN